ncbi:hypothetical protein BH23PLA1_BH23PLA1_37750 [soil metagenome]
MTAPHAITLRREPGPLTRSLAALLLRLGLGLFLLMAGFNKLQDIHGGSTPRQVLAAVDEEPVPDLDPIPEPMDEDEDEELEVQEPEANTLEEVEVQEPEANTLEEIEPDAHPEAGNDLKYPESIKSMFAGTIIENQPPGGLELFTTVLPYAEFALGAALILGLLTTLSSFLTGVLLLHLLFGLILLGDASKISSMYVYLLVNVGILWLSPVTSNYLSIDGLVAGWFWKPRAEGEYRHDESAEPRRGRG